MDLTELLNTFDEQTNEALFSLDKSEYLDLDSFSILTRKNFGSNFAVFSLNIRSLPNKINQFINILSHLDNLPSVICIQEIWSSHSNLELPGYHPLEFYSRDRDGPANPNCGGGVGIFVRNDLNYHLIDIKNSVVKGVIESIWVKISTKNGNNKIIGCVYRPNTAPLACATKFNNTLEGILTHIKGKFGRDNITVAGDFNLDLFKYDSHKQTGEFLSLMFGQGLLPIITKPTRISNNSCTLIDNIFTDSYNVF